MSVESSILELPDESLLGILMACDPEDALRMAQTCKILHLVVSDSKHLWMSLLAKLDYDQAPDVGPHIDLDSLQAKEIKRIVVRALRSYNNWCCPDGPRTTRKQQVQLESHQLVGLKVLPGCQYLVVRSRNSAYFGVWDINQETLVARYLCNRRQSSAHDCALLKGGKIARVALRSRNPDQFKVVDFDLHRGHATLLFSDSIQNVRLISGLKVREEAILFQTYSNIVLTNPETGKIAMVAVESDDIDFDIVRGSLICLDTAMDGTVHLFVAKLSRIFEHIQCESGRIALKDICDICRVLPVMQPTFISRYTLTICDPLSWGSARPCRILLANVDYRSSIDPGNKTVQVHRLYLEGGHSCSDLALTYDCSSNRVELGESSNRPLTITHCPSIPGRWMLPSRPGKGKYDIMVRRLWEDDVRLSPSDNFPSAIREEAERFSGTQIWYLQGGNCILHSFD